MLSLQQSMLYVVLTLPCILLESNSMAPCVFAGWFTLAVTYVKNTFEAIANGRHGDLSSFQREEDVHRSFYRHCQNAKLPPPRLPALSPYLSAFRVSLLPSSTPPPRTFPSLTPLCHSSSMSSTSPSNIYDLTVKDLRGNDVSLNTYQGKVLLIVNVASQCGLTTSNYTELADMYSKYKDQGLEILAFPCNQFGGQEPGTNEEIEQFACTRFKAEYPLFDKVDVNGSNAAPLFKFLKKSKGGLFGDSIKWNFTKFLVNKEGQVVERFAPTTSPSKIEKDVKKQLGIS